jgi:hypothetical protein
MFSRAISVVFLRPIGSFIPYAASIPRDNMPLWLGRFHREGLPVARLWENHSALISLGLNAKGKPGLWLVQKTR